MITFSDIVSHGPNMFQFGELGDTKIKNEDILNIHSSVPNSEIHNIKSVLPRTLCDVEDSYVLIIRNFFISDCLELYEEFKKLRWDTHRIKGEELVENKLGYRLAFMNMNETEIYPLNILTKSGTVYNHFKIPSLNRITLFLENTLCGPLLSEAVLFYDRNICNTPINREKRNKIIKLCVGYSITISFRWFKGTMSVSDEYNITLNNGDICIFSENATGYHKDSKTKLYNKYSEY